MKRWNDGQHRHDGLKPPIFGGCLPYADSRRTVSWARLQRRVPPLELGHRGVMVDRTVIEPVFQHMLVCATDLRPGAMPRMVMISLPSISVPDGVEVLFLLEIAHTLLHLVHGGREHHRLATVLSGRVGAGQPVQSLI